MTSKGYRRHILGTARKPEELIECDGKFYKPLPPSSTTSSSAKDSEVQAISDEALQKHEDAIDLYDQMQAAVREIIYRTIDKTTFIQVKNEKDTASVWKKVVLIHADKGIHCPRVGPGRVEAIFSGPDPGPQGRATLSLALALWDASTKPKFFQMW